jgi:hypothetical protein
MYYDYIKCELNVFHDEPKCDLWTYLTHARNDLIKDVLKFISHL